MAKYRKVDPKIWNDEKFLAFSNTSKLMFLLMLTHPHMTPLGAMRHTPIGLGAELGLSEEASREAFQEVLKEGLIEFDEKASFLGVPNFLRYNPPESPNVVKAWEKCWSDIPECELKSRLYKRVKAFAEAFGKAFGDAFAEDMP